MCTLLACCAAAAGEHYVQGQGLSSPEVAVESAMAALLEAKLPRQTDGLMSIGMVGNVLERGLLTEIQVVCKVGR